MKLSSLISLLALATLSIVSAQFAKSYTDPTTGIKFQHINPFTQSPQVSYGIALPPNPTNSFIGLIAGPVTNGWVGFAFGGGMTGSLLLTAWYTGSSIVHSLRHTNIYAEPQPYPHSGPVLTRISTVINSTHWVLIFRCTNCASGFDIQGFDLAGDIGILGCAVSSMTPYNPASPSSPLPSHGDDFSLFVADLVEARSPSWYASMINDPVSPSSTSLSLSASAYVPTASTTSFSTSTVSSTAGLMSSSTSTTSFLTPSSSVPTVPLQQRWGQCGGIGWKGATRCVAPYICQVQNPYYSQCL